jgi:hypothetical protein
MMKSLLLCCVLSISILPSAAAREWFVRQADADASNTADGSSEHPFRTINAAAQVAQPGDVVTVGAGIYHEWVSPARSGSAAAPILYRSVPEHAAVVRGTDVFDAAWQPAPDAPGCFVAPLPQKAFVFGNPFWRPTETAKKQPQWVYKADALVFLKDQPLTQVTTREDLVKTRGSWMSTNDGKQLLVHLEGDTAPAKDAIEITTRDRIFVPARRGLQFIHVEGFVFERCASRPGFPQLGAVSTRTGRYWTIRNNIVRYTTGKGIDCGSETWDAGSLNNTDPADKRLMIGGNHLVEGNVLSENAECGIAAWNTDHVRIIGNVVRNNASRGGEKPIYFLADAEAAGIKVHAFRFGVIEGNLVENNSSFGIWLDNGWENARVTRNVCLANRGSGIFVELGFGPILVDHNLCAANTALWLPYLGDGIYTHDASGIAITHNTLLDNARDGVHELVVSERSYANRRLCEASNITITANVFSGNKNADICLPPDSPRSRNNQSDHNVLDASAHFVINNNERRIRIQDILKSCRLQLDAANMPEDQRPNLSELKPTLSLPKLSLPAWRVVMQMDQTSTSLPANFRTQLDAKQHQLTIELPSADTIPLSPAGPADDFDLLGEPIKDGKSRAGAIQNLTAGKQTITFWPLPATTQPVSASAHP